MITMEKPLIYRGYSFQHREGAGVIYDNAGKVWLQFGDTVGLVTLKAVIEKYKEGYELGLKHGEEAAKANVRAALGL